MSDENPSVEITPETEVSNGTTVIENKDTDMQNEKIDYLGIDLGFGDVKVSAGTKFEIKKLYKFPSAIGAVQLNDHFQDSRVITMGEESFYVGEDALNLESGQIYELIEYAHLEKFTPVILHKVFRDLGFDNDNHPKKLVLGLSVAHIKHSAYYKKRVDEYLNSLGWEVETKILPQGAGIKVTADEYGDSFPHHPQDFTAANNYLISDIGFNTLDVIYVTNGKVVPNNVRGIEQRGAVVIAARLNEYIKQSYNREYSSKELKDIIDKGFLRIRGTKFDLTEVLTQLKLDYLKMIQDLMEAEFGAIMDKCDYIFLSGGGAYFFQDVVASDQFFRASKQSAEFYNAVGYYLNARK